MDLQQSSLDFIVRKYQWKAITCHEQVQQGIRRGRGLASNHEEAENVTIDLVPTTDVVFGEVRPDTNEGDDGVQTVHA